MCTRKGKVPTLPLLNEPTGEAIIAFRMLVGNHNFIIALAEREERTEQNQDIHLFFTIPNSTKVKRERYSNDSELEKGGGKTGKKWGWKK